MGRASGDRFPNDFNEASGRETSRLDRGALSLLKALAEPGAYAASNEESAREYLVVAAPRRGASVRVGKFTAAAGVALASAGLIREEVGQVSGRRRFEITAEGRARLVRDHAPADVDPFLAQQRPLVRAVANPGVIVDQAESPLAWLATRKGADGQPLIDAASLEAGERLRRDLTAASMLPRVTANWSAAGKARGAAVAEYSDRTIAARQRVAAAFDQVGADFASILFDVCGFLKGLEAVESERGWPRRSAKVILKLALRQLARHYRIEAVAVGPEKSRGLRHWGAGDYRPAISPDEPDA